MKGRLKACKDRNERTQRKDAKQTLAIKIESRKSDLG
jgi:hypothetical protein